MFFGDTSRCPLCLQRDGVLKSSWFRQVPIFCACFFFSRQNFRLRSMENFQNNVCYKHVTCLVYICLIGHFWQKHVNFLCFQNNCNQLRAGQNSTLFKSSEIISTEQWKEEVDSSVVLIGFLHTLSNQDHFVILIMLTLLIGHTFSLTIFMFFFF